MSFVAHFHLCHVLNSVAVRKTEASQRESEAARGFEKPRSPVLSVVSPLVWLAALRVAERPLCGPLRINYSMTQ